jgi:drug/metabolite transporter superfamily protein YnfA
LLFLSFIAMFKANFMYVLLIIMSFVFFFGGFIQSLQSALVGAVYFAVGTLFYIASLLHKQVYAEEMKALKQKQQDKRAKFLAKTKNREDKWKSA